MPSSLSIEAARRLRPDGPFHLSPGAQPLRATIDLTLENAPASEPEIVFTDTRRDMQWRVSMTPADNAWTAQVMMPPDVTIIRYHFEFADKSTLRETVQVEGRNRPIFGQWTQRDFQIAVYDPRKMPAEWTQGMVTYQIFPDRFANGDTSTDREAMGVYGHAPKFMQWNDIPEAPPLGRDFYGGDLRGIIDKLDYLSELGIDCIYMTPVFASPSNHRYDALDYLKIDPMLGTEADLVELTEKAHARNINVILDAVYNHCSCDAPYFDVIGRYGKHGATQSKQSPYYRWFNFDKWPTSYQSWIGLTHMPEFVECPEVEEFFLGPEGVTAYWLKRGVDGFRTDVTDCNSDEFWRRFRRVVDAVRPGAYLITEEWEDASHYMLGDTFSGTMNYRFAWALHGFFVYDKISASELDDRLLTWQRDTPPPALKTQMNLIASHDTGRVLTFSEGSRSRFVQTVAFQLSYAGAPMIYYGDELGLEGKYAEDARRTIDWDNFDSNADLLIFYKRAIAARRNHPALRQGDTETILIDDERRIYAFARRHEGQTVYCVFNASDQAASVKISVNEAGQWADLLQTHATIDVQDDALSVEMQPRGSAWYVRA